MSREHRSSTEPTARPRRLRRTATLAATALPLAIGALPLASAPAQAADPQSASSGPCSVTAERPYHNGKFTPSGKKMVNYPIKVSCDRKDVTVHLQQELAESDHGPDNTVLKWFGKDAQTFTEPGTRTVASEHWLRNTEDGDEETFHRVKFRVESNGVSSGWIRLQSPYRSIGN